MLVFQCLYVLELVLNKVADTIAAHGAKLVGDPCIVWQEAIYFYPVLKVQNA